MTSEGDTTIVLELGTRMEDDNELMELQETYSAKDYAMRVPCIGERVILSSYEHDHVNFIT